MKSDLAVITSVPFDHDYWHMPTLQIVVANAHTQPVATWFGENARVHAGFDVHIVDLSEASVDGAADAFVFVVDEHAALELLTESDDPKWQYKPVGVIGYGSPALIPAAKEALASLAMTTIDHSITIEDLDQRTEAMEIAAQGMLDELWCLDPFLGALRAWAATTELAESA